MQIKTIALSGDRGKGMYATVDVSDYDRLIKHSWCLDVGGGYPMTRCKGKTYRMHRMVKTDVPRGMVVDHINRDKLDNRKDNLRIVNHSVNSINANLQSNNKSGFTGVCWSTRDKRWIAQGSFNSKRYLIGYFKSKEDAIAARKKWGSVHAIS